MPIHEQHILTVEDLGNRWRRSCTCGFQTYAWEKRFHPLKPAATTECPNDRTVRALSTLQFSSGGLFDGKPVDGYAVHLIRSTNRGTPGPTLCGIDRFAKDCPGWSVGGGLTGPNIKHPPCPGCIAAARSEFPDLKVVGSIGAAEANAALEVDNLASVDCRPSSSDGGDDRG